MKRLNLKTLFKSISNQSRLEILLLILDNTLTASEISKKLDMDISTIYRHLQSMKNLGILKSERKNGVEFFDFVSPKIFKVIENAVEFISEVNGLSLMDYGYSNLKEYYFTSNDSQFVPCKILDMRGEICPVPDIQTKKVLESMDKDEILLVIVDYPLSAERIPISVKKVGHEVLKIVFNYPSEFKIYIKIR